jgi:YihY family inner membrane protein
VSTALVVPETRQLTGDDAWRTLSRVGWARLLRDSLRRFRDADAFSHARSLAYLTALVAIQGVIAVVGLARAVHGGRVSAFIDATLRHTIPGPAGRVLTSAAVQAHRSGSSHPYLALVIGAAGALVTATSAMSQLERGLNRLYGIDRDRRLIKRHAVAFLLTLSVGTLIAAAFVSLALGRELFPASSGGAVASAWSVGEWPLGLGLMLIAVTVLFRWSPRRRQPQLSWLALGSGVSVILWVVVTLGLGLFFRSSSAFGTTYGPLAGVVALLMWSLFSSVALLFGAALAAQLEVVRSGVLSGRDGAEVER